MEHLVEAVRFVHIEVTRLLFGVSSKRKKMMSQRLRSIRRPPLLEELFWSSKMHFWIGSKLVQDSTSTSKIYTTTQIPPSQKKCFPFFTLTKERKTGLKRNWRLVKKNYVIWEKEHSVYQPS